MNNSEEILTDEDMPELEEDDLSDKNENKNIDESVFDTDKFIKVDKEIEDVWIKRNIRPSYRGERIVMIYNDNQSSIEADARLFEFNRAETLIKDIPKCTPFQLFCILEYFSRNGNKENVKLILKDQRVDQICNDFRSLKAAYVNMHYDICNILLSDVKVKKYLETHYNKKNDIQFIKDIVDKINGNDKNTKEIIEYAQKLV